MTQRTPHDGRPYYCDRCGAGFGEYCACERSDCKLESLAFAQSRQIIFVRSGSIGEQEQSR
jgi:hypothetical protein